MIEKTEEPLSPTHRRCKKCNHIGPKDSFYRSLAPGTPAFRPRCPACKVTGPVALIWTNREGEIRKNYSTR